ncbi:hypothetical protein [Photorhabdus bodei]|uniref:Uncharacterized protein n=1 Tax=Photorhabdus bodei TaxID=2029681 RepID=A0AAW6BIC2_9GAMM|nr:hypothetical protein [Photorhabdus bodei]MDB6372453.1 hypothetical protein [Photorhabdus bodei]
MTGVSECSQQRGSLKDDGYNYFGDFLIAVHWLFIVANHIKIVAHFSYKNISLLFF